MKLSYDYHGINDAETGDRLATLSDSVKQSKNKDKIGNLLAASDDMYKALCGLIAELESIKIPAPGLIHAKKAVKRAEKGEKL